ncbi:MAG: thymidylate synthase (FAD) [Candidatus Cloacimonetes bacterium HGW-Cloacimonetes-1]|jgi:flavin-dependent thymidylate synthase|nr:MAG: thymidylate synthase (FAD) [Candidatus Cloacimonetes bacterium HGW-Cloacimonetes-1]
MQIVLAGYNIDKSLIERFIENQETTPEVISAAYARISRSSKSISELRQEALSQINKARTSNENIIFEMGHSSVAEHAVFNIDIIGVSRLLTETLQRSRLASFTEKSQRYVTFHNDFIVPSELDHDLKVQYVALMGELFREYQQTLGSLLIQVMADYPLLKKREQEGMAKEDARYILPLATKTQMGMTINARSLEALLRRLNGLNTSEALELSQQLYRVVKDLTPSLIRYTEPDSFYQKCFEMTFPGSSQKPRSSVTLLSSPDEADLQILAALLYSNAHTGYQEILDYLSQADAEEIARLSEQLYQDMQVWHKLPRAFEMAEFTFELHMSESCWAQFKRHRLCTIIRQKHSFDDLQIVPPNIPADSRERWEILLAKSCQLGQLIESKHPGIGAYALTNSHQVTVLVRMNLRELHHFVRLRSDEHAQWEIRVLSQEIARIIKTLCPITAKYLMGKSEFVPSQQSN